MRHGMAGCLAQGGLRGGEMRVALIAHRTAAEHRIAPRPADQRLDIGRVEGDRALEQRARLVEIPIERGLSLKIEVHRIGMR